MVSGFDGSLTLSLLFFVAATSRFVARRKVRQCISVDYLQSLVSNVPALLLQIFFPPPAAICSHARSRLLSRLQAQQKRSFASAENKVLTDTYKKISEEVAKSDARNLEKLFYETFPEAAENPTDASVAAMKTAFAAIHTAATNVRADCSVALLFDRLFGARIQLEVPACHVLNPQTETWNYLPLFF